MTDISLKVPPIQLTDMGMKEKYFPLTRSLGCDAGKIT
jgi:hypothetical protein